LSKLGGLLDLSGGSGVGSGINITEMTSKYMPGHVLFIMRVIWSCKILRKGWRTCPSA
jgi:hypothetical protein